MDILVSMAKSINKSFFQYYDELDVEGGNSKWCRPPVLQLAKEYAGTNPKDENFQQKWFAALLCFTVILSPCRYGGCMPEPSEETRQQILDAGRQILTKMDDQELYLFCFRLPDGHDAQGIYDLFK